MNTSPDDKSVIILMTCGPSTPGRCATPFFVSSLLASMDADVHVFMTMEAVRLAHKGVAENLTAVTGGKNILQFMREARELGVKIHVCTPALPGYDMAADLDIIDDIDELSSGGVLADMLLSCDKVISF